MKTEQTKFYARMSLLSVIITVIPASIVHFYEFGYRAFIAGAGIILLICVLFFMYRRTKNKFFILAYGIINAFIIIGFGLINGFWNHAFKIFLTYLHNGLPPLLSKLFLNPQIGSFIYETMGILIFAASMFAAYYGYKFIRDIIKEENHEELN